MGSTHQGSSRREKLATFLLKTEPSTYSWDDLVRDGKTVWDGVANPTAVRHIRSARKGDLAVIYHTGEEKRAVGLAEVTAPGRDDPKDAKLAVFELKPRKPLAAPVTLAQLKADKAFADSPLVKMGRLSVVPLDDAQLAALLRLAGTKP